MNSIKFGIGNISDENHRLRNMNSMPKMDKEPIKARSVIMSTKSSIKSSTRTIASIFCFF